MIRSPLDFDDSNTTFDNNSPQGAQGDPDDTGAQGDPGDKGDTGAQGDKGDPGDQGDTGDQGDKGDTGDPGDKGDTGAQGDKGDTGAQGDQGDTGDPGDKGDTGAQGDQGDTGAQGDKGDTGAQGDKGDTGAQGDKGDTETDLWKQPFILDASMTSIWAGALVDHGTMSSPFLWDASTPSVLTGFSGQGMMSFIETSSSNHPTKTCSAIWNIPAITDSNIYQVTLKVHAYGTQVGTYDLYLEGDDDTDTQTLLSGTGQINTNTDDLAKTYTINIDAGVLTGSLNKIIFQYTSGTTYDSDFAIQLIKIERTT